jgi:hypothetical protein
MTTIADARRLAAPLLARNTDLAMVRRLALLKPVTHVLRGFELERSLDPDLFNPTWFVLFTFEPRKYVHFSWGERFLGLWERSDVNLAARVVEKMEGEILPLLRPMRAIDDFASFANSEHVGHPLRNYPHKVFLVHVGLGQLDEARALCRKLRAWAIAECRLNHRPNMSVIRIVLEMVPLVEADDREGMVRLLWQWEAETIKNLKLEKYWVKEPFPLEEQNGLAVWREG